MNYHHKIFGYGDETASSAAVKSSFRKLKNVTFKNISLPTDIELFLEHHISSLRGMSLLKSSRNVLKDTTIHNNGQGHFNKESSPLYDEIDINKESLLTHSANASVQNSPPYEESHTRMRSPTYYSDSNSVEEKSQQYYEESHTIKISSPTSPIDMYSDSTVECLDTESLDRSIYEKKMPVNDSYEKKVDNYIDSISTNFNTTIKTKKCPLCAVGDFPTDKSQKCATCETPVHTLSNHQQRGHHENTLSIE